MPPPKPETPQCQCGHVRSAHWYGRRTKRYWHCKRTVGNKGNNVNTELCPCTQFVLAAKIDREKTLEIYKCVQI